MVSYKWFTILGEFWNWTGNSLPHMKKQYSFLLCLKSDDMTDDMLLLNSIDSFYSLTQKWSLLIVLVIKINKLEKKKYKGNYVQNRN